MSDAVIYNDEGLDVLESVSKKQDQTDCSADVITDDNSVLDVVNKGQESGEIFDGKTSVSSHNDGDVNSLFDQQSEISSGIDHDSSDEIIDSEVSNIISKDKPENSIEHSKEIPSPQKKSIVAGHLSYRDSIGIDLEASTLSPCFPLIRDKEKSLIPVIENRDDAEEDLDSKEDVDKDDKDDTNQTELKQDIEEQSGTNKNVGDRKLNNKDGLDREGERTEEVKMDAQNTYDSVLSQVSEINLTAQSESKLCDKVLFETKEGQLESKEGLIHQLRNQINNRGKLVDMECHVGKLEIKSDIEGEGETQKNHTDLLESTVDHKTDLIHQLEGRGNIEELSEDEAAPYGQLEIKKDFPVEKVIENDAKEQLKTKYHLQGQLEMDIKMEEQLGNKNCNENPSEREQYLKRQSNINKEINNLEAKKLQIWNSEEDKKENFLNSPGGNDTTMNDSIGIVSSSIDSKNIFEDLHHASQKDASNINCKKTLKIEDDNDDVETVADAVEDTSAVVADLSGDTSGELSADISYISSIDDEDDHEPTPYNIINENIYLINKKKSRMHKEVRRMKCDCSYEPDEPDYVGCGSGCMNRLLMIECGSKCTCGEFCTNKSFQRGCRYDLEVFKAGKKGWGLKTKERIDEGVFVIEYCGEVVNYSEFMQRTETYDQERRKHYYFMTLKANEIIDATRSGSISRFINHSCDPNCVTQKWTINGFLRVGFFSLREIKAGEELSFDYQYQRYGEKAQKCLCGTAKCRGVIGENKKVPLKNTSSSCDSPKRKTKKKTNSDYSAHFPFGEDIAEVLGEEQRIVSASQALSLTRLMITTSGLEERRNFLRVIMEATDAKALKAFIKYNGLSLLWSWMVEFPCDANFKIQVLNILKLLPIPNKNHLAESKLLPLIKKLSNCQDAQDSGGSSTRSDEEASSNSDNENNEALESGAKELTDKKPTKLETRKDSKDESSDGDRNLTDEDSDNSERNEEIISLATELLDRWKLLREVFKIPKKTPLTPDQGKPSIGTEAIVSNSEDKRNSKRKLDKDGPAGIFSPKRQFHLQSPRNNSPIKTVTESSHVLQSPSKQLASPISKRLGELESASEYSRNIIPPRESPLKSRLEDIARESWSANDEFSDSHGRGRGRLARGPANLSWRNNSQQFQDSPPMAGNFRGHRGGRGRARGRGRGNFSQSGFQNADNNLSPSPDRASLEFQQNQPRDFHGQNFPLSGPNELEDMNRMSSTPYNYQGIGQDVYKNRESNFHGNIHSQRYQNTPNTRFSNPEYETRLREQQPGWQPSFGVNQPPHNYSPARMPANMNQVTPPALSQSFGSMQMMNQNPQNQNLPRQHFQSWNVDTPTPGVVEHDRRQFDGHGGMLRPLPIGCQSQNVSYGYPHTAPQYPEQTQQQPNTFYDGQHQYPNNQQQRFQQQQPLHQQQQQQQQQPPPHHQHHQQLSATGSVPPSAVTPSSIMKHLHEMVQNNKVSASQEPQQPQYQQQEQLQQPYQQQQHFPQQQPPPQQQQQHQQQQPHFKAHENRTPELNEQSMSLSTPTRDNLNTSGSESPSSKKPGTVLPPNWKTATDPEGKIYYYHTVTRKTQWELPKWKNENQQKQANVEVKQIQPVVAAVAGPHTNRPVGNSTAPGPHTPPASPPHSPITPVKYTARPPAISDPAVSTTRMNTTNIVASEVTPKQQKIRDHFKMKLSGVVVNCLNPYQKVDCKHARIAKVDDFKFLARKLTHGLMMKELARVKADEELECNDSVKIKVKEYIRNYMKKYGEFYIRS